MWHNLLLPKELNKAMLNYFLYDTETCSNKLLEPHQHQGPRVQGSLKSEKHPNIILEIVRVQNGGRPPGREIRLLDVYNERPVRVSAKVLVPVKEHPKVFIQMNIHV